MIKILLLLFLILILFFIKSKKNISENLNLNLMDFVKHNHHKFLLNLNDNKLHLKIYYNSLDFNHSKNYFPPSITNSPRVDSNYTLIFNKFNLLNENVININTYDTQSYENNLEKTFFNSLKDTTSIKYHIKGHENEKHEVISKNLIIENLLDKVPKIFLFFKKNEENYIVIYDGSYNLDLKGEEAYENIINFIEDTIKKYLLNNNCIINEDNLIKLNNNNYYKCDDSTLFIYT